MVTVVLIFLVKAGLTDLFAALTPADQQLKSPAKRLREIMAIKEIIILPDKQLRLVSKPVEKVTTASASSPPTCSKPCMTHPASGSPRSRWRDGAPGGDGSGQDATRTASPATTPRHHRSGDSDVVGGTLGPPRKAACRSRNITRTSSGPRRSPSASPISTARCVSATPTACSPSASSMSSITSMACCSSTISPG